MANNEPFALLRALINAKYKSETKSQPNNFYCFKCKVDNLSWEAVALNHPGCDVFKNLVGPSGHYCYRKQDVDRVYDGSGIRIYKVIEGNEVYYPQPRESYAVSRTTRKGKCASCEYCMKQDKNYPYPPPVYCSIQCKLKVDMPKHDDHDGDAAATDVQEPPQEIGNGDDLTIYDYDIFQD